MINLTTTNADLDRMLQESKPGLLPFLYAEWGQTTVEVVLHPSGLLAFAYFDRPHSEVNWPSEFLPFEMR